MPPTRNLLLHSLFSLRGNARACVYTEPMWGLSMMLVIPYASVFMLALGLSDEQIGLLATVSTLSQVAFSLVSGALTDKLGRRLTTAWADVLAWSIPCLVWAVAHDFWAFLLASVVNGAFQLATNAWDCLLVEDLNRSLITRVYSLIKVAGEFSALFAPIAAVLVSRFGLVPAVRILYVNAFVIMTAKIVLLYRTTTETRTGRLRREQTRGASVWSLLAGSGHVLRLFWTSKGTLLSLVIAAIVGAVTLVNNTFWQLVVNQRLGVPDPLLPFFPMVRSILAVTFFFTVIPRLTHGVDLKRPTLWGFLSYLAGQVLLVLVPAGATAGLGTYVLLALCLVLDAFGAGILFMLSWSLFALHVDQAERSRVMAMQRTAVLLVTAPFGWISGWLSGLDRAWPFLLT
ncbi:MAG: MFS transporter, partial [Actinobacteria bacterium]|nr:MFS transporter [Actinomycetota bacterium]